jgi:hypothetical protein
MRVLRPFIFLLLSCFVCLMYSSTGTDSDSKGQKNLKNILKKSAEYCEKLENLALFFVCKEKIKEEILIRPSMLQRVGGRAYSVPSIKENNEYVYDYQLIKKGKDIKESRILIEENGEQRYEKNAPLKTKRFYSLKSVFGPVGFLSKKVQDSYAYRLIKEDKIDRRKAYVIEVSPHGKIQDNPNYGKLWIDKEEFSVLKIEIEQESLIGFEAIEREAQRQSVEPIITSIHYYGVEKKGIRFPSKTVFKETYGDYLREKTTKSKVDIEYIDYKFFIVEVDVKFE